MPESAATYDIPLVIDLDGTLISSDSLHENFIEALFHAPGRLLRDLPALFGGRAGFKDALARVTPLDPAALPYRQEMLDLVASAKAGGSKVWLVTAADQRIAESVAVHFGFFDGVKGSDGQTNLKGRNKLDWLRKTFPQGFAYAGDSAADMPIFEAAQRAILVGNGVRYANRLRRADVAVETCGAEDLRTLKDWMGAFRIHQWAKNLLIFAPLFLGHLAGDLACVAKSVFAFFAFGLVASGTYVVNDLADLSADRAHPTKKHRAIASGRIGVGPALFASLLLIVSGLTLSFTLRPAFALCVLAYLLLTLAYSLGLKRFAMLDVALIGALFTLRIVMGTALHESLYFSPWLISFSAFFFVSLSLAKRHVEVMRAKARGAQQVKGRGYRPDDWPLTLGYGLATANVSILIMMLFIALEAGASGGYAHPAWLYAAPAGVFLWSQRIWLLSHRTELHDDPIVFALKDRVSYAIGAIVAAGFALAL